MNRVAIVTRMTLVVASSLPFVGCGKSGEDTAAEASIQQKSDRLGEIRKTSGGDWSRVSAEDRKYLLELARGSETSAKMLLMRPQGAAPGGGGPVGRPGGPMGRPGGSPGPGGQPVGGNR